MHCWRWSLSACFFFLVAFAAGLIGSDYVDAGTVRLTWKDTSDIEHGFKIERLNGSAYLTIGTVGPNIQSYTDSDVNPGQSYCYRVSAFNASGVSLSSNTACATATNPSVSLVASPSTTLTLNSKAASRANSPIVTDAKWRDYRLTTIVRSPKEGVLGVLFRYQDRQNYYRFLWDYEKRVYRLEKRIDGTFEVLAQDTTIDTGPRPYRLEITAYGPFLKISINGKTTIAVTDSSLGSGTIGLYSYRNTAAAFDDVLVTEIPIGNILLSDNFNKLEYRGWTIIDERNPSRPSQWSAAAKALVRVGSKSESLGSYALFTRGSWGDYNVTLKMRSGDQSRSGVMFRFQDSENHYSFSCDGVGRRLIKRAQGMSQTIAEQTIPCLVGKTYVVQILAQGSSLQVKLDGELTFSANDDSFNGGTIALLSSIGESTTYDDVLVEELTTNTILLKDDFSSGAVAGWTIFDAPSGKSQVSDWKVVDEELVRSNVLRSNMSNDNLTFVIY